MPRRSSTAARQLGVRPSAVSRQVLVDYVAGGAD
jgi:hypothetical protein